MNVYEQELIMKEQHRINITNVKFSDNFLDNMCFFIDLLEGGYQGSFLTFNLNTFCFGLKKYINDIGRCDEDVETFTNLIKKKKIKKLIKDAYNGYIFEMYINELIELNSNYKITSFEKSEETESGALGVHIVFERKKEV